MRKRYRCSRIYMTIIVCLDKNGGQMFNRRRQSRDSAVTADICRIVGKRCLFCSPYSAQLFARAGIALHISSKFLSDAGKDDICFVEDAAVPQKEDCKEIIVYNWNRDYPADLYFDRDRLDGFRKTDVEEFKGISHEKITKEVYER